MHEKNLSDKSQDITPQTGLKMASPKAFEPIVFFSKDKDFIFAHQKIEKLVAAVYMMTNFLQNEEPLKWSLRSLGMKLLRLNIDFKESASKTATALETDIREVVLEMVSLLEVASFAGLISEMNLSILKKEFHALLEHIQRTLGRKYDGDLLNEDGFFATEMPQSAAPVREEVLKTGERKMTEMTFANDSRVPSPTPSRFKDNSDEEIKSLETVEGKNRTLKDYGPVAVKHNKRQSAIINLLKKKKEIMVRDVAEIVHDCSEKTIQRELLALVGEGVLKKTGERRWSRYSLV